MNSTGLRFGAYEIETLLGPGGVTETYRGHKGGAPDKPMALKLLRPDRGGSDAKVAMIFKNLAFRNRQLDVPGLVRVMDVSLDPSTVFIVSEGWTASNCPACGMPIAPPGSKRCGP